MIVKAGSQRSRGRSQAECSAVVAAGHGSQSVTGCIPASVISSGDASAQREGGEEQEQLRARLFRVQGQLKKSLEDIEDISQRRDVAGGLAAAANAVRSCACAPRGLLARSQDLRELVAL